jgi:nucleoside-diphosphate-sugar epimerase
MTQDLIFITGVNGFVGFKVLRKTLEAGYRVRATVRREEVIATVKSAHSIKPYLDKLEIIILKDVGALGAYHGLLEGVTYVLHVATPIPSDVSDDDDLQEKVINTAVRGSVALLEEALKIPTIKRVIITSSISAITSFQDMTSDPTDKVFTHETRVHNATFTNRWDVYFASKSEALNATLAFMEEKKPHFDMISLMPGCVLGAHEIASSIVEVSCPMNIVPLGILLGQPGVGPLAMTAVHIDDVAELHILSLNPKIEGNRSYILIADGSCSMSWSEASKYAQELYPEAVKDGRFPLNGGQQDFPLKYETRDTEKMFDFKFKTYKEQVASLCDQYLELLAKVPIGTDSIRLTV